MRSLIPQRKYQIARLITGFLLAGAFALSACATSHVSPEGQDNEQAEKPLNRPPAEGEMFFEDKPLPKGPKLVEGYRPAAAPGAVKDLPVEPVQEKADATSIHRKTLDRFIKNGPRYALKLVNVQPAFEGRPFIGYKVVGFSPTGRHLKGILEQGDIVVAVNERAIVRPEDYMAAWESLKTCDKVQINVLRKGEPVSMSWAVAGAH